jgi:hypothetical protein
VENEVPSDTVVVVTVIGETVVGFTANGKYSWASSAWADNEAALLTNGREKFPAALWAAVS